ncbi:PAS domain-containing hybrid sensor histidine kinase/response regulator [Coxiella burnetii]|uniref:histidine kinase n=1 Tax=Coxiella burnetii (strain RSA 493 / Nine Mile phase I) TaxID=227377 RepID=Q83DE9_COXBU|nr:ATP-binding protein [Coxiella burnetii]NP_819809.2 two component system histidine kinase [Coxiella burnetii RSA 493]AAO90323.2 two component system histidine kinase [Coxiella burnetii RSA 493]ARI65624.1 hybrid sensor histidine kinase/response regulator [Coxiella burnetii]ARK27101.1 hybrid sensor histidine kinase/response regulator [Coxiella burnetii]ATN74225.1 hybrid sensor histidine kinase/response regulator [Coxiella burnetii]ATN76131.1 hybrid sensor histidine kinase/response regulator [
MGLIINIVDHFFSIFYLLKSKMSMSLDAIISNKFSFEVFINQIDCPLLFISDEGFIEAANDFAIKLLQLKPDQFPDVDFHAFCRANKYSLSRFFNKVEPPTEALEETYLLKGRQYVILWKIIRFSQFDDMLKGSLLVGHDRTQLQLVSGELKSKIFFYENILSKLPTNVYWKDKNSVYLGCNERLARVMGLPSRKAIEGMTDFDFVWGKEAAKSFIEFDQKVMRSGIPLMTEDVFKEASGNIVTVLTNKTPLKNEHGETIGVLAISVDITELKKTQAQLEIQRQKAEAANKAKSEFIANMSHDIRTPIAGMLGMLQDLLNVAEETKTSSNASILNVIETVQRDSELLMGATDELLQLCNEILEVIRLESGKESEQSEAFDLRELIKRTIELLQPVAHQKKLTLACEVDEGIPQYLDGIRMYLSRTLLNLISNALKFTENGFVKVKVRLSDKTNSHYRVGDKATIQIAVEDTGMGIPRDKFDTIFEHFSRLTPSYEGLYKGAGLGLYTVKRYVDAMGGEITVDSEVGKGTCFTVIIPFTVADHAERTNEPLRLPKTPKRIDLKANVFAEGAKPSETALSVLVVEDNALAATAVAVVLKPFNCAVDFAESGAQAIEKARKGIYDLILMDVGLPDISGIEATQRIRAMEDKAKAQVPIIALTGHADNGEKRQECLEAGMQEVLSKPLQRLAIESTLEQFIFRAKAEKEAKSGPPVTSMPESTEVIDWNACVRMCNGSPEFTRQLLTILDEDLKSTRAKLEKAYQERNNEILRAELHRLRGGVSYLKLPQLDNALKMFHEVVKIEPPNPALLEESYSKAKKAIEAFLKMWEKQSF